MSNNKKSKRIKKEKRIGKKNLKLMEKVIDNGYTGMKTRYFLEKAIESAKEDILK